MARGYIEQHSPYLKDEKLQAVMEVYDSCFGEKNALAMEIRIPEPLSDAQISAIEEALKNVSARVTEKLRSIALEIIRLKLKIVEMEG